MAFAKIILNGDVLMDVTSDTVEASKLLSTYTATKNDGTKISGSYVPPSPVISSLTVTPTETAQTFNAAAVSGYKPVTVNAISSNYIGSAIPLKSAADISMSYNNATDTADITSPYGYYSSQAIYKMSRALSNMSGPLFKSSAGLFSGAVNITTSGYISSKTISYSHQLTTLSAQTIYPSTADQTIASYRWLTGTQTIKSVTTSNLTAANIKSGVVVRVGDANNAGRISTVTGTYQPSPTISALTVTPTETQQTFNAAAVDGYKPVTISAIPSAYIIPSGTSNITSNGTYDIASYQSVSVSVAGSGGGEKIISYIERKNYLDFTSELSAAENIGRYAFAEYVFFSDNTYIDLPNANTIGSYAFSGAVNLSGISAPNCYMVSAGAFKGTKISYCTLKSSFAHIASETFMNCSNLISFSAPSVYVVGTNAFLSCYAIEEVYLPSLSTIWPMGFAYCSSLKSVSFPKASSVYSSAFIGCTQLSTIRLGYLSKVEANTFMDCSALESVSFSAVTSVGVGAFSRCISLEEVSIPLCSYIGNSAFASCYALRSIYMPSVSIIGQYAFDRCSALSYISLPSSQSVSIGTGAFRYCTGLKKVVLPFVSSIAQQAFVPCSVLETAYLRSVSSMGQSMFESCISLLSVYMLGSSITSGGYYMFKNTPISSSTYYGYYGSIFVRESLYSSYITKAQWSAYSSRFVSLTDAEIEALEF